MFLRSQETDQLWATLVVPKSDVEVVGVLSQVLGGKQGLDRLFFWRPNFAWRARTLVDLRKEYAVANERPDRKTRVQEPDDSRAGTYIPVGQQKPEPSAPVVPTGGASGGTGTGGGADANSGESAG